MISAWENLHFATLELVRSTPIKQRLIAAYRRHLDARCRRRNFRARCARRSPKSCAVFALVQPLRGEDAVAASVRKMSNQEADDCAALIVEMFGAMCRADAGAARTSAAVVQLRSVDRLAE